MASKEEEQEEDAPRSLLEDEDTDSTTTATSTTTTSTSTFTTTTTTTTTTVSDDQPDEETDELYAGSCSTASPAAGDTAGEEATGEESRNKTASGDELAAEDKSISDQNTLTPTKNKPAPPSSLALSGSRPRRRKVLVAPALSLSLGRSDSAVSDDFPSAFLSPSLDDEDDTGLDFDLDGMETPSDSESLPFPVYDLDLEDDLRRLGVASRRHRARGSGPGSRSGSRSGSAPGADPTGLGCLEREDTVDSQGTRWRCFSMGHPPQDSRVNMSVLQPFLRVLSHGGYYGDGMNDIIVFSSCYLPENSLENYQYVMDNLFRFVVGTLELMVAENYVIVYLCAGGQKDKLPGIGWLRECYTTIDRRLRKNLKGLYVVHPTWYIKALITIIKPFISSKFSRKLQFVDSLQDLSRFIPTEHVQIPDCVRQYDQNSTR
ncbi:BCL2/adenovirus E1B 19 kDa protein-interacting protein 2-like isoform X2 [Centroberyx gerrardi]